MKMPYLSKSRLQVFLDCTQKYWAQYVDQQNATPSDTTFADLGTNVHQACQLAGMKNMDADDAWRHVAGRKAMPVQQYEDGLVMVKYFVDKVKDRLDGTLISYEYEIQPQGFKATDVPIKGFIDELRSIDVNTAHIIDYKTDYSIPTREELDDSLDSLIYAYALWKILGVSRCKVTWVYLRHDAVLSRDISRERLQQFEGWLKATWAAMKKFDKPVPNIGAGCRYCSYQCPTYLGIMAGTTKLAIPNIETLTTKDLIIKYDKLGDIEKVVKTYKEQVRDRLVAAVEASGSDKIEIDGASARLSFPYDTRVNEERFIEQFKGEPWFKDVVSVSITELKKVMKNLPEEQQKIINDMSTKVSTSKRLNVHVPRE